jgi:hypothetical protein
MLLGMDSCCLQLYDYCLGCWCKHDMSGHLPS